MSYRLIDGNALAAKYKEVNDMPCIYADLPNGLDGNHYVLEQSESCLIADALAPVCVDEKEQRAFDRGKIHERFAQQIFKEATS